MNIQKMMQQAQQMQQRMQDLQEKMGGLDVEGHAGSGMVKVVMSGKKIVRKVTINRDVVNPDDIETLEDLIAVAVNDAGQRADKLVADETSRLMEEFGMPAGAKLPF